MCLEDVWIVAFVIEPLNHMLHFPKTNVKYIRKIRLKWHLLHCYTETNQLVHKTLKKQKPKLGERRKTVFPIHSNVFLAG